MGYAVRKDGKGWRSVNSSDEVGQDEVFSESQPAPSQSQTKGVKWEAIKAERDRRQLDGGVKTDGHWFLSTERATSEYNTIINTTRGIPETTIVRAGWRTMDGAAIDMTPALALKILTAGIAQRCAIDDVAQAHKAAMEASADPSAYDFSGGWPKIFTDESQP